MTAGLADAGVGTQPGYDIAQGEKKTLISNCFGVFFGHTAWHAGS